jgi:hypothetical protein
VCGDLPRGQILLKLGLLLRTPCPSGLKGEGEWSIISMSISDKCSKWKVQYHFNVSYRHRDTLRLTVFLMFLASQPTGGLLMGLPTTKVPSASWYLTSPGSMRDLESYNSRGEGRDNSLIDD